MIPALVIFDCDGVLVDSEIISNQVMMANLARYGLTLDLSDCMRLFVGSTMVGVRTKARELGADLPKDWIDEVYEETYARLKQDVPVVAGIPTLLGKLGEAEIAFCVASNGSEEKMRITLGNNDLWDLFQGRMFSAHTLGTAKPDPTLFEIAARQFGASPQSCVVIEDSTSGVTAAARAGMRCLGYAPHHDGDDLRALGAEVFKDMVDVSALLGL